MERLIVMKLKPESKIQNRMNYSVIIFFILALHMSITKCPHMMIHRHPGGAKMAGVLLIVVNGVGKIFLQYLK